MYNKQTSTRLTNVIFVAQSFSAASFIAMFTLLSIVAVELSGRESYAGLPSTVLTLGRALTALPIGILMGRFGRRFGLSLGYGVSAIGAFLGVFAISQGSFLLLVFSSALLGFGRAGTEQGRFAAGDMFHLEDRARMIGRIVFAGTVGAIFGPLLVAPSGTFAEYLSLDTNTGPWVLSTAFLIIATIIIFVFLRPEPMEIAREIAGEEKVKNNVEERPARPTRQLLGIPSIQLAILSMLISQAVMATLMVITPLHMSQHGHDKGGISLVLMAHTLGMFGLSSLTGRLVDRYGRVPMMIAGAGILISATLVSPLSATVPILMLGLFLLGLGWNFAYVAGSTMLADGLEGEEKGRMQGMNDMFVAGAAALASFSSGPMFGTGGYTGVAGVGLVLTILFLWLIKLLGHSSEPKLKRP